MLKLIHNSYKLILILCFIAGMRIAFIHVPLVRDVGIYAYNAQEINRGKILYKEMVDTKFPLTDFTLAFAFRVFGDALETVRIAGALVFLLAAFLLYLPAKSLAGESIALWTTLIFGIFGSTASLQGYTSQTEVFMNFPAVACIALALTAARRNSRGWACGAGIALAIAFSYKQVAVTNWLVIAAIFLLPIAGRETAWQGRRFLNLTAAAIIGFISVIGFWVLYFIRVDALDDFLYWTVTHIFRYMVCDYSAAFFPSLFRSLAKVSLTNLPLLFAAAIGLAYGAGRRSNLRTFAVIWSAASFIGVFGGAKFFLHYYLQVLPPLALLAGFGLSSLFSGETRMTNRLIYYSAAGLLLISSVSYVARHLPDFLWKSPSETSFDASGSRLFADVYDVAQYLKERTDPGDFAFVWGSESSIYFYSKLRCPTKYHFDAVFAWDMPDGAIQTIREGLLDRKPEYFIRIDREIGGFARESSRNKPLVRPGAKSGFVELKQSRLVGAIMEILNKTYDFEKRIGMARIYRRKSMAFYTHGIEIEKH